MCYTNLLLGYCTYLLTHNAQSKALLVTDGVGSFLAVELRLFEQLTRNRVSRWSNHHLRITKTHTQLRLNRGRNDTRRVIKILWGAKICCYQMPFFNLNMHQIRSPLGSLGCWQRSLRPPSWISWGGGAWHQSRKRENMEGDGLKGGGKVRGGWCRHAGKGPVCVIGTPQCAATPLVLTFAVNKLRRARHQSLV